ncbi:MAG TPA: hypothetical protein VK828_09780 [Terriglobales bacterium]|jgi:hypothetical protein|nr:hypothetical protein [Terriglobales bacterium]
MRYRTIASKRIGLPVLFVMAILTGSARTQNQTPANSGPSLALTMRWIQDTLNDRGSVTYVDSTNLGKDGIVTSNVSTRVSGAVVDAASCTLHWTTTMDMSGPGPDDHAQTATTTIVPLKDIESVVVQSGREREGQTSSTHSPEFYAVTLVSSKAVIRMRTTVKITSEFKDSDPPPQDFDKTVPTETILIPDEDTAHRLAKSLTVAVKLCGRGNKDSF